MAHIARLPLRFAAGAAAVTALVAAPQDAAACGGLFCSQTPIDQTAEHILFTLNEDDTTTVHVQIRYAGDRDDFAWIIPVPGVPKLEASFPDRAFSALDVATQPRYMKNTCSVLEGDAATGGPRAVPGANGSVDVLARQNVGPFSTVTLTGDGAAEIVDWLQSNGFRITDAMIPLLQPYVADGMNFVALELRPDQDVSDISPLSLTYAGTQPMIPIRLTAVAAQPEMGIVAFFLGAQRYETSNFVNLQIPDSLIEFDRYGYQNNYLTLVSTESDKVGGQAFVTEYAGATTELRQTFVDSVVPPDQPDAEAAKATLVDLFTKFPHFTRLYARMSAEEMTADPLFRASTKPGDVSNVHDLTDPNFDWATSCNNTTPPTVDPCTFTYCGREGSCAPMVDDPNSGPQGACACTGDAIARVTTTGQQPAAYCEPIAMNLEDAPSSGAPLFVAACEGFSCGDHGECVSMNGNATCRCEAGYGAVANIYDTATSTQKPLTCVQLKSAPPPPPRLPAIGETRVFPDDDGDGASSDGGGCAVRSGNAGSGGAIAASLAALALAMGAARRRRSPRS